VSPLLCVQTGERKTAASSLLASTEAARERIAALEAARASLDESVSALSARLATVLHAGIGLGSAALQTLSGSGAAPAALLRVTDAALLSPSGESSSLPASCRAC
jgi:hypothetical protein